MTVPVLGACVTPAGCAFRVWAPRAAQVEVLLELPVPRRELLQPSGDGYFSATVANVSAGSRYRYVLDGASSFPDPCSRFQPEGPHGASMVVDPSAFVWSDAGWRGLKLHGQVLYELHIGAFTPEGTFDAASEKLSHLKSLGITAVEIMPVAECPGRWNWGYDGASLFAPSHRYGEYAAMQRFVDRAHQLGIGVILDVVYNHVGPDGNYLGCYSPGYFSDRYATEWGAPLNFDGPESAPVRDFVIANACEWIESFHLDGLRLDATQSIFDASRPHILAELAIRARAAAGARHILLTAENEPQKADHLKSVEAGGFGFDAMWNDDFHHAARVAATGRTHAYFHDYRGRAQEFISAAKYGFLFQGQYYRWQKQPRGQPLTTEAASCIAFLQNHDQVANTPGSKRLHQQTSPARLRALTAVLLLGPQTPLLFMGQEFWASSPFHFFADHAEPLRSQVRAGRGSFMEQFPGAASEAAKAAMQDPASESTFKASQLNWGELSHNVGAMGLHKDLLTLRRTDPVISRHRDADLDGAVLAEHAFLLRWFNTGHGDRLLIVNLARELDLAPVPEPLLAPPSGTKWLLIWSSEDGDYGGGGIENPLTPQGWYFPAESAVLFRAEPDTDQGGDPP